MCVTFFGLVVYVAGQKQRVDAVRAQQQEVKEPVVARLQERSGKRFTDERPIAVVDGAAGGEGSTRPGSARGGALGCVLWPSLPFEAPPTGDRSVPAAGARAPRRIGRELGLCHPP